MVSKKIIVSPIILIISTILMNIAIANTTSTGLQYDIGYTITIKAGAETLYSKVVSNASIGSAGTSLISINYNILEPSSSYIVPQATQTYTEYQTYTTTVTKTITLPSGETKVVTTVETVTIPEESKPWAGIDPKIAGIGVLAGSILLFLLLRR